MKEILNVASAKIRMTRTGVFKVSIRTFVDRNGKVLIIPLKASRLGETIHEAWYSAVHDFWGQYDCLGNHEEKLLSDTGIQKFLEKYQAKIKLHRSLGDYCCEISSFRTMTGFFIYGRGYDSDSPEIAITQAIETATKHLTK